MLTTTLHPPVSVCKSPFSNGRHLYSKTAWIGLPGILRWNRVSICAPVKVTPSSPDRAALSNDSSVLHSEGAQKTYSTITATSTIPLSTSSTRVSVHQLRNLIQEAFDSHGCFRLVYEVASYSNVGSIVDVVIVLHLSDPVQSCTNSSANESTTFNSAQSVFISSSRYIMNTSMHGVFEIEALMSACIADLLGVWC